MLPALYIGRFQPFHNGHLDAVRQCFEHEEKVLIAIGSAAEEHQPENPFALGERVQMIEAALSPFAEYAGRFTVVAVPNINNNEKWPAHVESLVPRFGTVYTGSDLTATLFRTYSAHPVSLLNKNIDQCASDLRTKMLHDEPWEVLVPEPVAQLLKKWRAVERIKTIARDSKS